MTWQAAVDEYIRVIDEGAPDVEVDRALDTMRDALGADA